MFKTKELPVDKNMGKYYEDPETGYYYYGYCIELIYKIQESMKVNNLRHSLFRTVSNHNTFWAITEVKWKVDISILLVSICTQTYISVATFVNKLQFDFTIVEPPDGSYGSMKDDGSWDGMIKMLIDDVSRILKYSSLLTTREGNVFTGLCLGSVHPMRGRGCLLGVVPNRGVGLMQTPNSDIQ